MIRFPRKIPSNSGFTWFQVGAADFVHPHLIGEMPMTRVFDQLAEVFEVACAMIWANPLPWPTRAIAPLERARALAAGWVLAHRFVSPC